MQGRLRGVQFAIVLVCFVRRHSAAASATAGVVDELTELGSKQLDNDENELLVAAKELAEKSSDETPVKRRETELGINRVNERATGQRTHDGVSVLPWSGNADAHLLSLMLDVTRRVSALQEAVTDMRQENKLNYRQLKRQLVKLSSSDNANRPTNYDDGRQRALHSAAFHVDQPQADQHKQSNQYQQETMKTPESKTKPAKQQQQQSSGLLERSRCARGFEYSAELDGCYRLTGERTTWRMARQRCRQLDADLAVVDSARHQRYINMKARSNPDTRHCDFWIGLVRGRGGVDGSSSTWHWVGDIGNARTPAYTNWNVNEPNNANSYEHCTQMLWIFSWRWNDAHCNYGSACYICQAKAAATPP